MPEEKKKKKKLEGMMMIIIDGELPDLLLVMNIIEMKTILRQQSVLL